MESETCGERPSPGHCTRGQATSSGRTVLFRVSIGECLSRAVARRCCKSAAAPSSPADTFIDEPGAFAIRARRALHFAVAVAAETHVCTSARSSYRRFVAGSQGFCHCTPSLSSCRFARRANRVSILIRRGKAYATPRTSSRWVLLISTYKLSRKPCGTALSSFNCLQYSQYHPCLLSATRDSPAPLSPAMPHRPTGRRRLARTPACWRAGPERESAAANADWC